MFFNDNWPELKNKKGRESAWTPTREMRPRPRPRRRPPNHSQLAFSVDNKVRCRATCNRMVTSEDIDRALVAFEKAMAAFS